MLIYSSVGTVVTAVMAARARREERREDARDVTSALMLASAVTTAPVCAV